jgi:type I restriction enzyme S subunit
MIFNESKHNAHWPVRTLSDLGTFARGKSKHRPRNDKRLFEKGKFPLIQTGEVREAGLFIRKHNVAYNELGLRQSKIWPTGTLCITIAANIAETALLGYPMCFPDSVVGFNANRDLSSEVYLHYVFTYIREAIKRATSGSIQDNINIEFLTALRFRFPDKTEQDKIVEVLSTLDAKIELNNRINTELEAMAKLLYDYWFVQFDFPISAAQAATMGNPKLEGKPYRASGGKMVCNEKLKREIPEGWRDGSLVDIATFTNGIACQKYPAEGGETLRVIKIKEMRTGLTPDSDIVTANVPSKVKIKNGDILFSWSASLEVMIWAGGEGALNQHIFKVTSDTNPRSFCYFVLLDYLLHFRMMADLRKTTMGHITIDHLEQSQIAIPAGNVAQAFEVVTKPIIDRMVKSHEENQELTQLRDWLLPMLMNGQVTVDS